jgi:hypothetical protein
MMWPCHQVDGGERIVGGPADTAGFAAIARVHQLAGGEGTVTKVLRGKSWRHTRTFGNAAKTTEAAETTLGGGNGAERQQADGHTDNPPPEKPTHRAHRRSPGPSGSVTR